MNKKGQTAIAGLLIGVIGVLIGLILIGNVLMPVTHTVNQTTWVNASNNSEGVLWQYSTSEWAMWGIIGIVIIAGAVLMVLKLFS